MYIRLTYALCTYKKAKYKNELFCNRTVQILKVSLTFRSVLYSRISTHTHTLTCTYTSK